MFELSRIQQGMWWDKSWNPIRLREGYGFGCTKVSSGCTNCWAERYSRRFYKTPPYDGRKRDFMLNQKVLTEPLRARKPRVYFVCDLMDLFHEDIPDDFILKVFQTMFRGWFDCNAAKWGYPHIHILLTKRPKRMAQFWKKHFKDEPCPKYVWLGVSVEDQKTADERIPILLQVPAAVRVVSIEPMLGSVDLQRIDGGSFNPEYKGLHLNALTGGCLSPTPWHLNWVICGGETGPGARPMHPNWPRRVRDDCVAAGVPFFFKSWGEWLRFDFDCIGTPPRDPEVGVSVGDCMFRVGKKQAGRLLDEQEWNQVPEMSGG